MMMTMTMTMMMLLQVLQSFQIMDYSLLMSVHNLDLAARENVRLTLLVDSFVYI